MSIELHHTYSHERLSLAGNVTADYTDHTDISNSASVKSVESAVQPSFESLTKLTYHVGVRTANPPNASSAKEATMNCKTLECVRQFFVCFVSFVVRSHAALETQVTSRSFQTAQPILGQG